MFYASGIILPGLFSFLFIPFVVNSYGTAAYAEYSLAYNTLNVISMFCYGWIGQSYIRFGSHFPASFLDHSVHLLRKSLLAGFLCFIVFEVLFSHASFTHILFFVPAFFLAGYYNFFIIICQAHQKAKRVAASELLRTIINLFLPLLLFTFFRRNYSIEILVLALTSSYLIPLILYFKKTKEEKAFIQDEKLILAKEEIKKQVLSYGIPVAFFLSISLALSVNDRFIVAKFMNLEEAGRYSSVYDVLNRGVTLACAAVLMTFHPYITQLYNNGNKQLAYKNIKRAFAIEVSLFLAGFVVLLFFGTDIWNLFFKQNISQSDLKLLLLIYCGVFVWQFGMLLHKPLELKKKTFLMAIGVAVALAFNVATNIFLLKIFQTLLVPAITTLLSSFIYILFIAGCLLLKKND